MPIFNLTLLPRGGILTFPDTLTTQGLSLWSLNTVGGGILTFPDTLTTQGLSLWSLNTVQQFGGREWAEMTKGFHLL